MRLLNKAIIVRLRHYSGTNKYKVFSHPHIPLPHQEGTDPVICPVLFLVQVSTPEDFGGHRCRGYSDIKAHVVMQSETAKAKCAASSPIRRCQAVSASKAPTKRVALLH